MIIEIYTFYNVAWFVSSIAQDQVAERDSRAEEAQDFCNHQILMKIVIQNLAKVAGLGTTLAELYEPDVLLAQEINLSTESIDTVSNTSRLGYGTAIYTRGDAASNVRNVTSPNAELGGFIFKKTTVADCMGVQFVSFHGYNGQPMRNVQKLVSHVNAVLSVLDVDRPSVFAGDFNTWSQTHIDAVKAVLAEAGFDLAYSWPYPGRDLPLDHAFVRGVQLDKSFSYTCGSDHRGAVLEINVP